MFFLNYATVIDPLLRDIRAYTVEFSGMKTGDWALDVACGTGAQVLEYARRGAIATGIDMNPGMIELARRGKRKSGLGASFQVADALSLPFGDNLFDYVSISLALHEMKREFRNGVIAEMKRVARKKAALLFIDFQSPLPWNAYGYLIRAAEFAAGSEHHRNSVDFIAQGGLDVLLERNRLSIEKRGYLKYGGVTVIKSRVGA